MSDLSWLNPTPHAIAVYASQPLSPVATQHSLPSGRYSLLGPDFHRLDRTSFAWRTHSITLSASASSLSGTVMPSSLAALISMMARSTRSNRKPDTLMQDRLPDCLGGSLPDASRPPAYSLNVTSWHNLPGPPAAIRVRLPYPSRTRDRVTGFQTFGYAQSQCIGTGRPSDTA